MLSPQTDEERLAKYFAQLEREIDWISDSELEIVLARPCKYRKLLEDSNKKHGREKETGSLRQHPRQEGEDCSG